MYEKGKLVKSVLRVRPWVVAAGMINGSGDSLDPEGVQKPSVVREGRTVGIRMHSACCVCSVQGPSLQPSALKYWLSYSPADTARFDINASHHVLDDPRHRPQPLCPCQTQRVGS